MGNKQLRPEQGGQFIGFTDQQLSYLKQKFQALSDQSRLLSVDKICQCLQCSPNQAQKLLDYIDFDGQGKIDFYEFTCAAASLHANDDEAVQFLYSIYTGGEGLDQDSFKLLFQTVYKYLRYMDLIKEDFTNELAEAKFKKYDYNQNGLIGQDEFKAMLLNDFHCRIWMQTLGFCDQNELAIETAKPQSEEFQLDAQAGDQAGSTPSWIKTIEYMTPQNYRREKRSQAPSASLQISYIFGYRSYDTRGNLHYNLAGDPVYHTAGCAIVLNKAKNTMKTHTAHNDDITCLDVNVQKNIAVSGQMGRRPSLIVWDPQTLEVKQTFTGKLIRSIGCVAVSRSGRLVAGVDLDTDHNIAVYDVASGSVVATGKGPKSTIYSIKFGKNQDQIICASQKEVVFASFGNGSLKLKKGVFGKCPPLATLSLAIVGDNIVGGTSDGSLAIWKGGFCSKMVKQHSKAVSALTERGDGGLISGDSQGKIVFWSVTMAKERQILLDKLTANNPLNHHGVIALSELNGNVLVGTRGAEILELNRGAVNVQMLMEGHFDQELWGLTVFSNKGECITGGQDKMLYKWDLLKRKRIIKRKTEYPITSIDLSRANVLAVGHRNGVLALYEADTLKHLRKIAAFKNPDKQVISVVKFSPNGALLAVGYCPPVSKVYIYDTNSLERVGICKGSPSRLLSIDFSQSGDFIQVNNTSYEILFYKSAGGQQVTAATTFRSEQWATMTSRFSWASQGIWPPCSDGTDINSLDRSNSKRYLATGDDFSKIKLFDYPVAERRQIHNSYKGHSSHVTGVKFTFDDKLLVTTGGLEKSVIVWSLEDQTELKYDYDESLLKEEKGITVDEAGDNQYVNDPNEEPPQEQNGWEVEAEGGDEAMAIKPFLGQVKAMTPPDFKLSAIKNTPPKQTLVLEHAWGVRNQYNIPKIDYVRNQVRYSANYESCVYITAALGVESDLNTKKQRFYQGQQEDIICFAMSADRKYCAMGQMAQRVDKSVKKIVDVHVWDADTKQCLAVLSGFHQRAVVLVSFSPSGKRLLTVGQDDKNSLAVYDWQQKRKAWSSPVCGEKVTGAAWKSETQYMTVGFKHVRLWNSGAGRMLKVEGKWIPMLSCVYWNDKFVSGDLTGNLYLWSGSSAAPLQAHASRVDLLAIDRNGQLYSGCGKGLINIWKLSGGRLVLDKKLMDLSQIDSLGAGILSLDFSPKNYLVCTASASIYEIPRNADAKLGSTNIVLQSHFNGELWACCWSPDGNRFVTGGDDNMIRIYEAQSYKQIESYKMTCRVRGLDWEQSAGELIVVGDQKGKIYLFNSELKLLDEAKTKFSRTKPRQQPFWIEDVKFSPDGKYVAFGAHGGASHLEIYAIDGDKFGTATIINNLLSSALLSVDWSQGSDMLAVISQAYELQFTSLTQKISASSVKSVKWATWSGKFGFSVQQIHQDVTYSHINAVATSPSRSLIATGSDDQKVKIFNYPVVHPRQQHKAYIGHSSHVTRVRFSRDEQWLLTTGGNDRTTLLWKIEDPDGAEKKKARVQQQEEQEVPEQQEVPEDEPAEAEDSNDIDQQSIGIPGNSKVEKELAKTATDDFQVDADAGDEFMAVKPWLGAIKEPTKEFYRGSGKAPPVSLSLQFAHGYRVKDCRNNLKFVTPSTIVYHTAGLGVLMDISTQERQQTFFDKHTDDIISMDWDGNIAFTGQMGAKPIIYAWDARGQMIQSYKGAKKGVSAVGVNQKFVAGVGMDDNHMIYLFDRKTGQLLCSQKGGRDVVLCLKWCGPENFVTVGVKHFKQWTITGKTIAAKNGIFGKNCNLLCSAVVSPSESVIVGAADGSLQVWKGNTCASAVKAHQKAIQALCCKEQLILSGSDDATIKIFREGSLELVKTIGLTQLIAHSMSRSVRAMDFIDSKLIVGTLGSEIYEIRCSTSIASCKADSEFRLIANHMNGHYAPNYVTNEVWGLCRVDDDVYATCADDGTVRLWSLRDNAQVGDASLMFDAKLKPLKMNGKFLPEEAVGRCIACSKDGQLVVGCKDGSVKVLANDLKPMKVVKNSKKQISQIKFSPDGSIVAIGSHDGVIYIYGWSEGSLTLKSKSIKHNSYIKFFDFSRDGNYLHSVCGAYQLLFWDVNTGRQITGGATMTRDEQWATWNITLGWPVQGVWQPFMDGTDVNSVDRSNSQHQKGMKWLASGDDRGKVRILEYPCVVKNSEGVVGRGHSSHVTSVMFTLDDTTLLSTGGEDQTILVWKVAEK